MTRAEAIAAWTGARSPPRPQGLCVLGQGASEAQGKEQVTFEVGVDGSVEAPYNPPDETDVRRLGKLGLALLLFRSHYPRRQRAVLEVLSAPPDRPISRPANASSTRNAPGATAPAAPAAPDPTCSARPCGTRRTTRRWSTSCATAFPAPRCRRSPSPSPTTWRGRPPPTCARSAATRHGGFPATRSAARALYESTGCASCHVVNGRGGVLGPELTSIGALRGAPLPARRDRQAGSGASARLSRRAARCRQRPRDPRHPRQRRRVLDPHPRRRAARCTCCRNPSCRGVDRELEATLMPSYASRFSAAELDDLVAYLATLRGAK